MPHLDSNTQNGEPQNAARRATICLLTYGDFLPYFQRSLFSVDRYTPHEQIHLRIGFNEAPNSYHIALGRLKQDWQDPDRKPLPQGGECVTFNGDAGMKIHLWNSPVNLYKEPMSRHMYYDLPIETEYVVWLDDDTYVEPGWWAELCKLFDKKIDYIGQPWWVHYLPGQTEMIQSQKWYREVPFEEYKGKIGTRFMTGGFIAIRTERLYQADFPDTNLRWKGEHLQQYGGDTLLGEIARQLGWSQATHAKHLKINVDLDGNHPAPRRGGTGKQFGSDLNVVIR
jgi:hypothetical protein